MAPLVLMQGLPSPAGTFATGGGLGGATKVGFLVQPSDADVDAVISPAIQVAVQDAVGNTIPWVEKTVALELLTGTGALAGTTPQTTVGGIATFSDISLTAEGDKTLRATCAGLTSVTSDVVTIGTGSGDEPIFGGSDASYFFDDFQSFADTTDLITYESHFAGRWIINAATGISLENVAGAKAYRATYTPSNGNIILETSFSFNSVFSPGDEMVISWDFTIMNGYEWAPNPDGGGNKIFLVRGGSEPYDFIIGSEPLVVQGVGRDWYAGWNTRHYTINWINNNIQQNMNFGTNPDTTNDGVTRRVTWWSRFPSSGAAGDGAIRMWVGGIQVMEYDGADSERPEFGLIFNPIPSELSGFRMPANRNTSPSSGSHWLQFDNVRVWEPA